MLCIGKAFLVTREVFRELFLLPQTLLAQGMSAYSQKILKSLNSPKISGLSKTGLTFSHRSFNISSAKREL